MAANQANRVLETLTRHLVNSPLSVIEWDHEFRVKFWSGQAEAIFGWSEDQVRGKHPEDWPFVHEGDTEAVNQIMEALLTVSTTRNISLNRNYTRDGRIIHCEWYNSLLFDEAGKLVSILSLIQDVTAREAMESELRQLHKVKSIGQLTGGVAHDFNNLLTVILGNGELLAERLEHRPELGELAGTVVDAARKGATLTHQLLAFARQQPLQPRALDFNDLLTGMRVLLERTLGEETELKLITATGSWNAKVDPTQLESAMLNLCINARDAMPEGGHLTIETDNVTLDQDYADAHAEVEPGPYVMIAISDTGIGMTPEVIDQAFEPFFTTKDVGKGSGLGLSMVYGFIKQSRGHIKIYSEPGEGTTVRMYLPRADHADEVPASEIKPTTAVGGHESILVVEDDEMVRQYACLQLKMLGYQVFSAADGHQAIELMQGDVPVDLLFTDVVMPGGINGVELARRARQLRPDMAVLYTSGYTQNAIIHQGRLDPGVLLLSKPYPRAELARMIRLALS